MSKRKNIIEFLKRNQNDAFSLSEREIWCEAMRKEIEKDMRRTQRFQWFLLGIMGITCLVCIVGIVLKVLFP